MGHQCSPYPNEPLLPYCGGTNGQDTTKGGVIRRLSFNSRSSNEYEEEIDMTVTGLILMHLCPGCWGVDIPHDQTDDNEDVLGKHWLERDDIWALQWTLDETSTRLLLVRPSSAGHSRWQRLGQYYFWPGQNNNKKLQVGVFSAHSHNCLQASSRIQA